MPTSTHLPKKAVKAIYKAVDMVFDKVKDRYLKPERYKFSGIVVGREHQFSLPGLFVASSLSQRFKPDLDVLGVLIEMAGSYLDARKADTRAKVLKEVSSFLHEAKQQDVDTDWKTVLGGKLHDVWEKAAADVERIVTTEATTARNLGATPGIIAMSVAVGVDDPIVAYIPVHDEYLCDECRRLHLMGDNHTPRLWKLSEVGHGYHKRGEPNPKIGGLHPHCRCSQIVVMPGYGFDAAGRIVYKQPGYDAFAIQRE